AGTAGPKGSQPAWLLRFLSGGQLPAVAELALLGATRELRGVLATVFPAEQGGCDPTDTHGSVGPGGRGVGGRPLPRRIPRRLGPR
ncbi:unnamed protein product, partial [Polarella glacialis]